METTIVKPKDYRKGDFMPNMSLAILRRDPLVQEWLACYPKSTQENYLCNINNLFEITGKRPKDLVAMEAIEIKRLVKSVMGRLVQQNRLYSAKGAMDATRSFATHFEKSFKFAYGEKIRLGKIKNHIPPRAHMVYAIAEAASATSNPPNPRNRAMILLDWVTGLRSNALRSLRCGAILGYSEDDCPIPLRVGNEHQTIGRDLWCIDDKISGYGLDYFYTFIAKEGFLAVQDWMTYRKSHIGTPEPKDYLFCQVHASKSGKGPDSHVGDQLNRNTPWRAFKNALEKVGIDRESMTLHKLRSAFKSIMISAGVDEEVREVMMGHTPPGSQKNYFDFHDIEMTRKEYKKADWTRTGAHRLDKVEQDNIELRTKLAEVQSQLASKNAMDNQMYKMFQELLQRKVA